MLKKVTSPSVWRLHFILNKIIPIWFVVIVLFKDNVSLCSPGWPGTHRRVTFFCLDLLGLKAPSHHYHVWLPCSLNMTVFVCRLRVKDCMHANRCTCLSINWLREPFMMTLRQGRKSNLRKLKGFSEVYTARPWCRMWKEVPGLSLGLPLHCTTLPPGSGL